MGSSSTLAPAFNVIGTRHFVGSPVKYEESVCYCALPGMTEVKMLGATCWRPKLAFWNTGHTLNSELNQHITLRRPAAGNPSIKPMLFCR